MLCITAYVIPILRRPAAAAAAATRPTIAPSVTVRRSHDPNLQCHSLVQRAIGVPLQIGRVMDALRRRGAEIVRRAGHRLGATARRRHWRRTGVSGRERERDHRIGFLGSIIYNHKKIYVTYRRLNSGDPSTPSSCRLRRNRSGDWPRL